MMHKLFMPRADIIFHCSWGFKFCLQNKRSSIDSKLLTEFPSFSKLQLKSGNYISSYYFPFEKESIL